MSDVSDPTAGGSVPPKFEFKRVSDDAYKALSRGDLGGRVFTLDKDGTLKASTGWLSAWWARRKIDSGGRLMVTIDNLQPDQNFKPEGLLSRIVYWFRGEALPDSKWGVTASKVEKILLLSPAESNGYKFSDKPGPSDDANPNPIYPDVSPGDDPRRF